MGVVAAGVVAAGTVAAAGISAYSASQNKPAGAGGQDAMQAAQQLDFNRRMIDMNLEYLPQYGQAERNLTLLQRRFDQRYLNNQGGKLAAILGKVSPAYAGMQAQTQTALNEINNPSPLLTQLQADAARELSYGDQLSPEEERAAAQQARTGYSARGMGTGPSSLFAEVLNRDRFANEREQTRRQFAAGVYGMGLQNDAMNNQRRGWLLNASNAQLSPVLSAIYGNRSAVALNAPASAATSAPRVGNDAWMTQYNANMAAQNSAANNQAALLGAGINSASDIGSAYFRNRAQGYNAAGEAQYASNTVPRAQANY